MWTKPTTTHADMSNDGLKIFLQRQNCSDASHCTFTLLWPFLVCNMKIHVKTFGRLRRHWMQNLQRPREIRVVGGEEATKALNRWMLQCGKDDPFLHSTHTQFVLCYNPIELKLKLVSSSKLILKPVQCSASQLSTRYIFYARYQLSQKDQHWIFTLDNVFWSIDITHTTRSAEKQCDVPPAQNFAKQSSKWILPQKQFCQHGWCAVSLQKALRSVLLVFSS